MQRPFLNSRINYSSRLSRMNALNNNEPTFSEAVASLVPWTLSAMQLRGVSWAAMSTGGLSVLAKSTSCTCPAFRPGNARMELLELGHRTHRALGLGLVSNTCNCCGLCVKVYTLMTPSRTTTMRSRRSLTARTGALKSREMAASFFKSSHTTTKIFREGENLNYAWISGVIWGRVRNLRFFHLCWVGTLVPVRHRREPGSCTWRASRRGWVHHPESLASPFLSRGRSWTPWIHFSCHKQSNLPATTTLRPSSQSKLRRFTHPGPDWILRTGAPRLLLRTNSYQANIGHNSDALQAQKSLNAESANQLRL